MACSGLPEERMTVSGICGVLSTLYPEVCRHRDTFSIFDRERMCPFVWGHQCSAAFQELRASLIGRPDSGFSNRDWTVHSG